jgi:hypothetical protein
MATKRNLLLGGAALALAGSLGYVVRRAIIRTAEVTALNGSTPCSAGLAWSYGPGTRPLSVIIDLVAGSGSSGSITTDGEATSGEIPLPEAFSGPYTITTTATYRILGVPNTTVRTYTGTV